MHAGGLPPPAGLHVWLLVRPQIEGSRWYPCPRDIVAGADGSWECEVALGGDDSSEGPAGGLAANMPSPSGQAMEHEQDQALQAALGRLPEDYRRVITLRYQEQLAFEEIGRLLQRSPDAARKLWARAVERLHEELDPPP